MSIGWDSPDKSNFVGSGIDSGNDSYNDNIEDILTAEMENAIDTEIRLGMSNDDILMSLELYFGKRFKSREFTVRFIENHRAVLDCIK